MVLKLHYMDSSPPARSTLLTIKALGLEAELKPVNLLTGEHLSPEFLKLNPLHTVPTLEDDDFVIWDSHAINAYLVGKYGKDDSLYPKALQKKTIIDQRFYFDCGILFPRYANVVGCVFNGVKAVDKSSDAQLMTQGYAFLETFLERSTYVAGDQLSLADFSIVATVTSADILVPISPKKYPKISEWIAKMKALPYYDEANQVGLDNFAELMKSKLAEV